MARTEKSSDEYISEEVLLLLALQLWHYPQTLNAIYIYTYMVDALYRNWVLRA